MVLVNTAGDTSKSYGQLVVSSTLRSCEQAKRDGDDVSIRYMFFGDLTVCVHIDYIIRTLFVVIQY